MAALSVSFAEHLVRVIRLLPPALATNKSTSLKVAETFYHFLRGADFHEVASVVPGGYMMVQDKDSADSPTLLNTHCPYLAVDSSGKPIEVPTGWLDEVVSQAVAQINLGHHKGAVSHGLALHFDRAQRRAPPVRLTDQGDWLDWIRPCGMAGAQYLDFTLLTSKLQTNPVGIHRGCGLVRLQHSTCVPRGHDRLVCGSCNKLAVTLTRFVDTSGDLYDERREHLG